MDGRDQGTPTHTLALQIILNRAEGGGGDGLPTKREVKTAEWQERIKERSGKRSGDEG